MGAKAAGKLAEAGSPIMLAKVDATEQKKIAETHEVRGYPTLKFFKKGRAMDYMGGRTADTIVSWLEKKTGPPAVALATEDEAKISSKITRWPLSVSSRIKIVLKPK